MREGKGASIMDYFGTLEDPRIDRCKRHQLLDIHCHCHLRRHLRRRLLGLHRIVRQEQAGMVPDLPGTAPRHPVPRHLRRRLLPAGPGAVPAVLHGLDPGGVRPDPRGSGGHRRQTVRRSHDRNVGKRAIHLVSAWASANTLTLGQVKTAEKSNEITAIPQLLPILELKGASSPSTPWAASRRSPRGFWTGEPATCWR